MTTPPPSNAHAPLRSVAAAFCRDTHATVVGIRSRTCQRLSRPFIRPSYPLLLRGGGVDVYFSTLSPTVPTRRSSMFPNPASRHRPTALPLSTVSTLTSLRCLNRVVPNGRRLWGSPCCSRTRTYTRSLTPQTRRVEARREKKRRPDPADTCLNVLTTF